MFDNLGDKLQATFKKLSGKGKLTEKDIDEGLKEIKMALLEADVNYKVVKEFLNKIKEKSLGEEVMKSLTPGQQVIKIVNEELTSILGSKNKPLDFSQYPTVILLAGVQGSGKTTSAGKLANYLKKEKGKKVMLAACDTVRAAAVNQLKILGEKIDVAVFTEDNEAPETIAKHALTHATKNGFEVLIVDTAGRQHVSDDLMDEITRVNKAVKASEVLFTLDCMMGQQAVDSAKAFDDRLQITGYILSKTDSDARGGAALSVTYVTGKPIKFVGTGEKITDFEVFHPDRIASRILGMGDVLSFIEKAEHMIDEQKQKELVKKLSKNSFNLEDYLEQIESLSKMGGLRSLVDSLPMKGIKDVDFDEGEKELLKNKAIIQSMTLKERAKPELLNASRRRRIAMGSGTQVSDINKLIKGYDQAKKMMKQFSGSKRKFGAKNFPFM